MGHAFGTDPPPQPDGWVVPRVSRPQAAGLSAAVLAVRAAVDALAAQDRSDLSGREALADTAAVLGEAQRLHTLGLARLADVDRRSLFELNGASSTGRWVEAQGVGADRTDVAVARRLDAFPLVAEQVAQRRLTLAVAHRLQTVLARVRPHLDRPDGLVDGQPGEAVLSAVVVDGVRMLVAEARGGFPTDDDPVLAHLLTELPRLAAQPTSQLARLEAALVLLAQHVEPGQLQGCLGLLLDALLPEQLARRAARGRDRRRLRLVRHPDGSGWHLEGDLDLECGERLFTVLQSEMTRDPDNLLDTEQAAALREEGLDPYDPELGSVASPRSVAERRHDALSGGLGHYLAAELGGSHDKSPVQVAVTVPAEALEGAPGALPARAASGTALPRGLVRRWVCGSALTRVVLDLRGRAVETSHNERTLKPHERRALRAQTGSRCQGAGCRRSGCDPGTVLHPHHADPWSRCGTTSLADTVLLCQPCHHDVHDGGRVLRLKDGRRLGPDGWAAPQPDDPAAQGSAGC